MVLSDRRPYPTAEYRVANYGALRNGYMQPPGHSNVQILMGKRKENTYSLEHQKDLKRCVVKLLSIYCETGISQTWELSSIITKEETKVQTGEARCPGWHGLEGVNAILKLKIFWLRSPAFSIVSFSFLPLGRDMGREEKGEGSVWG